MSRRADARRRRQARRKLSHGRDEPPDVRAVRLPEGTRPRVPMVRPVKPRPKLVTMQPRPCPYCGSDAAVGPCPLSIECPHCGAPEGSSCKRPSGHRASQVHAERIAEAEAGLELPRSSAWQQPEQPPLFCPDNHRQEAMPV